jgi:putative Mg2+ transporter-C (MgtC) family protein
MISAWDIGWRLLLAALLGGVIGLDRERHEWAAGLRTHMLVCMGAALVVIVSAYGFSAVLALPHMVLDPSRIAAQVISGIGFLGAGSIFKEGLSVRGLTTAASIWITAAIGILIGVGFYFPAILATLLTLGILSAFRWIEARLPSHSYAHHALRFDRDAAMPEAEVRALLVSHGFTIANMSYRVSDDGLSFEYRMVIRTIDPPNTSRLADALRRLPQVRAFRISPTGD